MPLAAFEHSIPPFVDGSIRREPDLEHKYPAISCLCRAGKFAPRLEVGDVVAYMTRKGRFGTSQGQRRLTAVLRVRHLLPSHQAAAQWYRGRRLPLPSNCMVAGNSPKPFEHSHQIFQAGNCAGPTRTYQAWDAEYRWRAKNYGRFVICTPLFRDLTWDAPPVTEGVLYDVFGEVPATLNPGRRALDDGEELLKRLGIPAAVRR